jgi:hypothetical protein
MYTYDNNGNTIDLTPVKEQESDIQAQLLSEEVEHEQDEDEHTYKKECSYKKFLNWKFFLLLVLIILIIFYIYRENKNSSDDSTSISMSSRKSSKKIET